MIVQAIAVDAGDDVMNLPEQLRHYRLGLIFTLLVVALLVSVAWLLLLPDTLPVKHVRIEGEFHHLAPGRLQERASEVVRGGFFNVNVDTIQVTLLAEPWVKQVAVRRVWPDSINVYVHEQVAIAQWGIEGLLNSNAEFFSPPKETFPVGLPSLSGPEGTYQIVIDALRRANEILAPISLHVTSLTLSDRRAWQMMLNNRLSLVLGRNDMEERLQRFADYVPTSRLNEIDSIDMRYTNGFAIRWNSNLTTVEERQQ